MSDTAAPHVVLVNLGTPEAPEESAVRTFLSEFLSDPEVVDYPSWLWRPVLARILRSRPKRVAAMYRSIWTESGSPLKVGTKRISDALARSNVGTVSFAFRYGEPSVAKALANGSSPVIVPLFPQRTSSSSGTIERLATGRARIHRIAPDDPGYIAALADRWKHTVGGQPPEHFVVSFHAIPIRFDRAERSTYRRDCEATFQALLERTEWPGHKATLAYQSKFGPEPWIGPRTASVLRDLPAKGVRDVVVATPGFLTEGLETLEEIGIRAKQAFEAAGGQRFRRVPCVESHPAFVSSLATALARHEQGVPQSSRQLSRGPAVQPSTFSGRPEKGGA